MIGFSFYIGSLMHTHITLLEKSLVIPVSCISVVQCIATKKEMYLFIKLRGYLNLIELPGAFFFFFGCMLA